MVSGMNRPPLSQTLLRWLRRPFGGPARSASAPIPLTLQCMGVDDAALAELQARLGQVESRLGLRLRLSEDPGDAVLVDDAVMRSVSPWVLDAVCEGRLRLVLRRTGPPTAAAVRGVDLEDLVAQLRQLRGQAALGPEGRFLPSRSFDAAETQPEAADSGFDPAFDSRWPLDAAQPSAAAAVFFEAMLRLRTDPTAPPLQAAWPGGGVLILDGSKGMAWFDADGWMNLRLHEPLPRLQADVTPRGELAELELDRVLWMLGLAAEELPLLDAPADGWHAPLVPVHLQGIGRHTMQPRHLAMAHVLSRGGVTPSQLRREGQVSARQLRRFLQACLVLGLVAWRPARLPAWAEDEPGAA